MVVYIDMEKMIFWRTNIEEDEFKLKELSDSELEKAETFFNVKFPNGYISILKKQNGGYIIYNSHPSPIPTSWSDNSVNVEYIKGIGSGTGILNNPYLIKEWNLPQGIIIFSGDGHSFIGFDYRTTKNEPSVVYIQVEDIQDIRVIKLASNFNEFLKNLYVEEVVEVDEPALNIPTLNELVNAINEENIENIIRTLDTLPFNLNDDAATGFVEKLFILSSHPHEQVRYSVAEATNYLSDFFTLDNSILIRLSEIFLNDQNVDIQYFGSLIKDKLR